MVSAKGKIVAGNFDAILLRKKAGIAIEVGELLVSDSPDKSKVLLQVVDASYGSQINQKDVELASGLSLEREADASLRFIDGELRNYDVISCKPVLHITGATGQPCKTLPPFFSDVRALEQADLSFLTRPQHPLFLGNLRSGSKIFDAPLYVDAQEALAHHILIPATTGRGKSNLTKCMLWDIAGQDKVSCLVLDPHDEYFGRNGLGLKDHPRKEKIKYYTTKQVPPGGKTLKFHVSNLKPAHFSGVIFLSDPQQQAMHLFYQRFGQEWIMAALEQRKIDGVRFDEATLDVLKRKIMMLLGIEERISSTGARDYGCYGIFDFTGGTHTLPEIVSELETGSVVIVDTSALSGSIEILVGSIITHEALKLYQRHKMEDALKHKPVISIVLEEAPRVLANDESVFSQVAREGRKFKIGLIAITQLPSLIPRQILANMNTKIILGLEMAPEREAIIGSASQDLSGFSRAIASLDKGEAIITSTFTRFAVPIKIPLFEEFAENSRKAAKHAKQDLNIKIEGL